ncbi:(2Fe-2S)-binding protein [bacterium]|nr:MAG: (2Fe-2S)-binding protein [bacterium]
MILDPTPIRRCVCANVTFEELQEAGIESLEEAQDRFGASTYCETCVPYILRMLKTGQTAFPVTWPLEE